MNDKCPGCGACLAEGFKALWKCGSCLTFSGRFGQHPNCVRIAALQADNARLTAEVEGLHSENGKLSDLSISESMKLGSLTTRIAMLRDGCRRNSVKSRAPFEKRLWGDMQNLFQQLLEAPQ